MRPLSAVDSDQWSDGCQSSFSGGCSGGVRVSGGHLCEAEAPTEATAETSAPPEENEATPPTGHPELAEILRQ